MTATNHALTGAAIGLIVGEPLLAVPIALLSHYVCDALPHFGTSQPIEQMLRSRWFRNYLIAEAIICFALVALLLVAKPENWLLAAICAFVAAAPDLLSFNRFRKIRGHRLWQPNWYSKFAIRIQWFEKPIGAVVEMVWFMAAVFILLPFFIS